MYSGDASCPPVGLTSLLQAFLDQHPQANAGLLLYAGNVVRRLGEKIAALPWTMVTGWPAPGGS
jgi:hypothetical protein